MFKFLKDTLKSAISKFTSTVDKVGKEEVKEVVVKKEKPSKAQKPQKEDKKDSSRDHKREVPKTKQVEEKKVE